MIAPQLIEISKSYLCGNSHITDQSVQCPCGSRNLTSLAKILDREVIDYDHHILLSESVPRLWEN